VTAKVVYPEYSTFPQSFADYLKKETAKEIEQKSPLSRWYRNFTYASPNRQRQFAYETVTQEWNFAEISWISC
jgi:hypothetical protein